MRGRDCIRVALVLGLLALPACAETGSERDLRIDRPAAQGVDLLQAIVDGLESQMGEDLAQEADVLDDATLGQAAIYTLWVVDGEVNNGGFEQFFFNSSGALTDEAIAGTDVVGARAQGRILRQAASVYPGGDVPEVRDERDCILRSLPPSAACTLGSLDDRWFAQDRELERLMVAYVEAHPDEFFR